MPYSYAQSIERFTDADKNRIVAIFLNTEDPTEKTNWENATASFGSASIDSMKVSLRNSLRKVLVDDDGTATQPAPKTPRSGSKGGRKRKSTGAEDDNGDANIEGTPAPKKRSAGAGKTAAAAGAKTSEDGDEDVPVTPTPRKQRAKKTKGVKVEEGSGDEAVGGAEQHEGDGGVAATHTPKKRARKPKAVATPVKADPEPAEDDEVAGAEDGADGVAQEDVKKQDGGADGGEVQGEDNHVDTA